MLEKNLIKEKDRAPNVLGFEFYLDAFSELNSCRPPSFQGAGPIPFTAIVEYSKIYGIEDFEDFLYLIRIMDNALLDYESSKAKAQQPKAGKK